MGQVCKITICRLEVDAAWYPTHTDVHEYQLISGASQQTILVTTRCQQIVPENAVSELAAKALATAGLPRLQLDCHGYSWIATSSCIKDILSNTLSNNHSCSLSCQLIPSYSFHCFTYFWACVYVPESNEFTRQICCHLVSPKVSFLLMHSYDLIHNLHPLPI